MQKAFEGVDIYMSSQMRDAIESWIALEGTNGLKPVWVSDDIRTIRFSNTISRELARLVTQNIDIKCDGRYGSQDKAKLIQNALDKTFLTKAQDVIERMVRTGGVMAKWNGTGIDFLGPDRFLVTEHDSNGVITGCIFFSYYVEGKKYYTRAEYHRFQYEAEDDGTKVKEYKISNKAFISDRSDDLGDEIPLARTKWEKIEPETAIASLESPLFTYLKNPYSNTIDEDSPLGVSLFADCLEELRWLDIAISNMGIEAEESKPLMFVDEAAVMYAKEKGIELPKFIKGMQLGVSPDTTVQQWQPTLQTATRKEGINFLLSIISYKCGFDPGYFVFNGQTISVATATQVEATERRTVNTVLSYRNILDRPNVNGDGRTGFIHDLAFIIDAMSVLNGDSAEGDFGNYELYCDFADLTQNKEEDKAFEYQLTMQGFMARKRFLIRHLGCTDEEAEEMVNEATQERTQQLQAASLTGLFAGRE